MPKVKTGVFPCHDIDIQISTNGDTESPTFTPIKDMESASIDIDTGVETWNSFDTGGWQRALVTAKAINMSFSGKRNLGDPGNDYVASKAYLNGRDCDSIVKIEFPNGDSVQMPCVIAVTNPGSSDSTAVAPLEFDLNSNGKPTYEQASN